MELKQIRRLRSNCFCTLILIHLSIQWHGISTISSNLEIHLSTTTPHRVHGKEGNGKRKAETDGGNQKRKYKIKITCAN